MFFPFQDNIECVRFMSTTLKLKQHNKTTYLTAQENPYQQQLAI